MGREYPSLPVLAVAAIIVDNGEILLVKRANEPARGKWSPPGGVVELGESLVDAVRREVREECGLEIEVDGLLDVVEVVRRDSKGRIRFHYVILDYLAHPTGGELRPGEDASEVRWIPLRELENYEITQSLRKLVERHWSELLSR
ncbi:MAG TPA: NUDIX domain-containing protein [Candidatus Bathyarchaeota archaeon]|nr:MAG: NUDIX hydrolase [Candidatus Bathyarchaeota archaeon]HDM26947.1 NUDIX domain-containing protein [Candidatus Bathyarchaeota archaeon]